MGKVILVNIVPPKLIVYNVFIIHVLEIKSIDKVTEQDGCFKTRFIFYFCFFSKVGNNDRLKNDDRTMETHISEDT